MDLWFTVIVSVCLAALLKASINILNHSKASHNLPPGPFILPIIGNFLLRRKPLSELESYIRSLHAKLGPIITLKIGSTPVIFVADRSLAHQTLIQNSATFSNRPPPTPIAKITSSNQHNVNSSNYGPTWRLLRRNLTSEILHPTRIKSFSPARTYFLQMLVDRMESQSKSNGSVFIMEHLQFVMFGLLVTMCFGVTLDEGRIKQVEDTQRRLLLNFRRFNLLNFWPRVTKVLFWKIWKDFTQMREQQRRVFLSLMRDRSISSQTERKDDLEYNDTCYMDTLLDIELPEEKRKLNESEMISLCSEFLTAGSDTTSTALQWVMANLVKYPRIQQKVFEEIKTVVGNRSEVEEVKDGDLQKTRYLNAVVLESLRRHPPGHFVVPHAVAEDVVVNGYLIPKNVPINFMVAEMGWDSKVWEDPMEFKPERFMDGEVVFDIRGSKEVKMMPFGVGRRICPGLGLALLHLEYFVANLIWKYEWKAVDGDEVCLDEKTEFTIVMKNPLQARLIPRSFP